MKIRKKALLAVLCAALLCTGCKRHFENLGAPPFAEENTFGDNSSSSDFSSAGYSDSSSLEDTGFSSDDTTSSDEDSTSSNKDSTPPYDDRAPSNEDQTPSYEDQIPSNENSSPEDTTSPSEPIALGPYNQRAMTATEKAYCNEVFNLINNIRRENGLPEFKTLDKLDEVAALRAWENTVQYGHTRPDGRSCFTALDEGGLNYRHCAENVAAGYKTPADVVNGWMNSDGHRKNILNPDLEYLGVGCYLEKGDRGFSSYWAQMFYTPRNW